MSGDKSINEKEKGHTEVNKKTIFFFSDMLQYRFISRTTPWHVGKNLRFGTPHETNTLVFSVPYAKNLAPDANALSICIGGVKLPYCQI